jgi:hypothetical protein
MDVGNYTVLVSNAFGVTTSSIASVTVTGTPPTIISQPQNQSILSGQTATFSVAANGYLPFNYQWQFNQSNLPGATNSVLLLNNLQGTNSGIYRVVISNSFGVAISSNAVLTVVIPFNEALNTTGVVWSTTGNAAWFGQSAITHDGSAASQSGHISDNQQSLLQTSYVGPATISFWWKVSSEPFWDTLSFSVSGVSYTNISGEVDWQQQTFSIPTGMQVLQWIYSKDPDTSIGVDAGWLDQVTFVGGSPPPLLIQPIYSGSSFSASVPTISGKTYSMEYKNSLTDSVWTRVAITQGDGTIKTLVDTNATTSQRFYRLQQSN